MFLATGKSSLNKEIRKKEVRKMEVQMHCRLSFTSLHQRYWVDSNVKKLEVARTLEKSAQSCSRGFGDEAHFWLNGYVNKQNCRIWSEANPQVYVETPLHPEKLTVWCALWAGGILL
ncbi:hypothetical protein TNCV_1319671 [Trichonephila clavipes]|nr:hypothetical protein TNCV_1319671 [Trichonephila clavipes]